MFNFINTINFIAARALFTWTIALFCFQTYAQTPPDVKVENAWVRTAVEGQKGTGGFMKITAQQDMKLVGLSSPVAGLGEVHEMKMEGDLMKMRAIPGGLDLPAGKTIELKPGGMHLMLLDLKQGLPKDTTIPVTLLFKYKNGKDAKLELKLPVSVRAPEGAAADAHSGGMHKH